MRRHKEHKRISRLLPTGWLVTRSRAHKLKKKDPVPVTGMSSPSGLSMMPRRCGARLPLASTRTLRGRVLRSGCLSASGVPDKHNIRSEHQPTRVKVIRYIAQRPRSARLEVCFISERPWTSPPAHNWALGINYALTAIYESKVLLPNVTLEIYTFVITVRPYN